MTDLKPCPFCGGKMHVDEHEGCGDYFFECLKDMREGGCRMISGLYATEDQAIAAANRRASGWISVEERLPETGQSVLCYNPRAPDYCYREWVEIYGIKPPSDFYESVTHWMPLPEPPEAL